MLVPGTSAHDELTPPPPWDVCHMVPIRTMCHGCWSVMADPMHYSRRHSCMEAVEPCSPRACARRQPCALRHVPFAPSCASPVAALCGPNHSGDWTVCRAAPLFPPHSPAAPPSHSPTASQPHGRTVAQADTRNPFCASNCLPKLPLFFWSGPGVLCPWSRAECVVRLRVKGG